MFCIACGAKNPEYARYCHACGTGLLKTDAEPTATERSPASPTVVSAGPLAGIQLTDPADADGSTSASTPTPSQQVSAPSSLMERNVPEMTVAPRAKGNKLVIGFGWLFVAAAVYLLVAGLIAASGTPEALPHPSSFGSNQPITILSALVQAALFGATGWAILLEKNFAVKLVWTTTILAGIGVILRGIVPLDLLVWLVTLGLAIWYARTMSAAPGAGKETATPLATARASSASKRQRQDEKDQTARGNDRSNSLEIAARPAEPQETTPSPEHDKHPLEQQSFEPQFHVVLIAGCFILVTSLVLIVFFGLKAPAPSQSATSPKPDTSATASAASTQPSMAATSQAAVDQQPSEPMVPKTESTQGPKPVQATQALTGQALQWAQYAEQADAAREYEKAEKGYREALRLRPDSGPLWLLLSDVYTILGQYDQALKADQEAVRLDPNNAIAWDQLGVCHFKLRQYEQAVRSLREAIRLEPDDPDFTGSQADAWMNLGLAYGSLHKYDQALKAEQEAIRLKPDDEEAWYMTGSIYCDLHQDDEAIKAYREAVRLKPDDADAWEMLGLIYADQKNRSGIIEAYGRLKSLDPKRAADFFKQYVLP